MKKSIILSSVSFLIMSLSINHANARKLTDCEKVTMMNGYMLAFKARVNGKSAEEAVDMSMNHKNDLKAIHYRMMFEITGRPVYELSEKEWNKLRKKGSYKSLVAESMKRLDESKYCENW